MECQIGRTSAAPAICRRGLLSDRESFGSTWNLAELFVVDKERARDQRAFKKHILVCLLYSSLRSLVIRAQRLISARFCVRDAHMFFFVCG